MSKYKIEIEGSNAGGMRAVNETREAMEKLRGGVGGLSNALSGDLVGGATSALGALRGLVGLLLSNPWVALAAGIGLVVGKFAELRAAANEQTAAALKTVEDRVTSLRKAMGDLSVMTLPERLDQSVKKKDILTLSGELGQNSAAQKSLEDARARNQQEQIYAGGSPIQLDFLRDEAAQINALLQEKYYERKRIEAAIREVEDAISETEANATTAASEATAKLADASSASDRARLLAARSRQDAAMEAAAAMGPDETQLERKKASLSGLQDARARIEQYGSVAELAEVDADIAETMNAIARLESSIKDAKERQAEAAKRRAESEQAELARASSREADLRQRADEKKLKEAEKLAEDERAKELRQNRRGSADYLQDLRDSVGARGSRALAGTHSAVTMDQQQRTEMIALLREIRDRSGLAF